MIGPSGPAVSTNGGETWSWLGRRSPEGTTFTYAFGAEAKEVLFCVSIRYVEKDLKRFLKRFEGNDALRLDTLCTTAKGRRVEQIFAGRLDGKARLRALFACRHHACEMTASFALEGLLEEILAETETGRWFRQNVEVMAVPFMDKDGVEAGDQGKNRKPHDHNRDYGPGSLYPSVKTLQERVPAWSKGRLRLAVDLHCGGLDGEGNECIYFVGCQPQDHWERMGQLSKIPESVQSGPLPFSAAKNVAFGQSWNTVPHTGTAFQCWAEGLPEVKLAASMEFSSNRVGGKDMTPENTRAFGRDLARALRTYLDSLER